MNGVRASWSRYTVTGAVLIGQVAKRLQPKITKDPGTTKPWINWTQPVESTTKHAPPGETRVVAVGMMIN